MGAGEEILRQLQALHVKVDRLLDTAKPGGTGGGVADDRDLEGEHGDPKVRFIPRDWKGQDFKGCNYSATDPEFLMMLADALDYFATKKEGEDPKKAGYDRRDARRARGWSARLRAGWKPPEKPVTGFEEGW